MYATRPLSPNFGAEVLDFQLSGTPEGEDIAEIRALWAEHKLLLFRNQSFDEAALVGFSRAFGDLEIHVREEYLSPEHPEILYVSNIEREGRRIGILSDTEVGWHYDQIYLPKPAVGSLLMADTLPPEGGNTEFADMCAAWDALPEATRNNWTDVWPINPTKRLIKPIASLPITSRRRDHRTSTIRLCARTRLQAKRHSTYARV